MRLMKSVIEGNKRVYDELAREYDDKAQVRYEFNDQIVSRFARFLTKEASILDIGCAVGVDMKRMRSQGFTVTGIELSAAMAHFAQERNPESTIIIGDFLETEFAETFDAVYAQSFIHLFPSPHVPIVLGKINELLKTQGVAFFTTTCSENTREGWEKKKDYGNDLERFRKHYTEDEFKKIFLNSGFQIIDFYTLTDPFDKTFMNLTVRKDG